MALAFPQLSWWLWRGKENETAAAASSNGLNSSLDLNSGGVREFSSVKMPLRRRSKKKWQSRDERRIDREYDIVVVPSDGGCLSGSESDGSDWSVGWMEPHGFDFISDDETESFAVLVPCYGRAGAGAGTGTPGGDVSVDNGGNSRNQLLGTIVELTDGCSAESKKYMEQWLTSLQNS